VPAALLGVILFALIPHLYMAGASIDRLIVQLPARHRIGPVAYAEYARSTDLGRGRIVYPAANALGGAALLAALALALLLRESREVIVALVVAAFFALLARVVTRRAAPAMLQIGRSDDRESVITPLLERFARLAPIRMTCLSLASVSLLWAVLVR
jgi:hypothetical protein